ncbi:MAG: glycosyltransferase WbuB [Planctomycetota bacterium]
MRILIYGLNHAPEVVGVGKYTGELVKWLADQGHAVRIVTAPPYYPEWRVWPGHCGWHYCTEKNKFGWQTPSARVYRCPLFVPRRQSGLKRLLHLASFAISSAPIVLWQSLWWRPDCVVVITPTLLCAPAGWLAARLIGAAAWLHIQDFELDAAFELGLMRSGLLRSIAACGERWWLRRFDRVSTISSRMLERLSAKGVAEERRVLFPNWVNTETICPSEATNHLRRELNLGDDAVVALYAGNMGEKQGLEIILEVAAQLSGEPQLQFVLAGEGTARTQLVAKSAGLPNVRFLPLQPPERLNELLNLGQIHLLTQRAEIADFVMPSKLTGILAVGGAVIATARPGTELAQVLERAGGRVCPPGDAATMATQIVMLLRTPEVRRAMSVKARQYALAHFSHDKILADFESELREIYNDRTAGVPPALGS